MAKAPTTATRPARSRQQEAQGQKLCIDCAKSIDARARLCPECKQPQDWRRLVGGLQMTQFATTITAAGIAIYVALSAQDLLTPSAAIVTISRPVCEAPNKISFRVSKTGKNEAEILTLRMLRHEQGIGPISLSEDELETQSRKAGYIVGRRVLSYEIATKDSEDPFCDVVTPLPDGRLRKSCTFRFELEYKDRETGRLDRANATCKYDPNA